jgi:hypothetical protein
MQRGNKLRDANPGCAVVPGLSVVRLERHRLRTRQPADGGQVYRYAYGTGRADVLTLQLQDNLWWEYINAVSNPLEFLHAWPNLIL